VIHFLALAMMIPIPLLAQTVVGGKVALGGKIATTVATPVISSLTESPDANTVLLSWTTNIPSTTSASCGSFNAPYDASQDSVTSHSIPVPQLTPSTGYTCQACSSGACQTISATTQAYATSTPITGISLGSATIYNSSVMGDVYPEAVSNDGSTYLLIGDTTGYNGGSSCEYALVLAKATSLSPIAITNVNTFSTFTPGCELLAPDGNLSPHGFGFASVGGKLFISMTNQVECAGVPVCPGYYGNLMWSPDHGATWNSQTSPKTFTTGGAFNSPTTARMSPNGPPYFDYVQFVGQGVDDGTLGYATANKRVLNANAYSYQISNAQASTGVGISCAGEDYYLRRVPLSQLADLNPAEYTYFTGGDGTQASAWSTTQTSSASILHNAGNAANLPSYPGELCLANIEYIPALNRYLLLTTYWPNGVNNAGASTLLAYDTPTPWGPYRLVTTLSMGGYEDPHILQADAVAATLSPTTMRIIIASNPLTTYSPNIFTMTVSH
jgi:hypothetical protein